MKLPKVNVSEVRKGVIAVAGAVAEGVSLGVLHGEAETIAVAVLAFLSAVGVYTVPNAPKVAPVVVATVSGTIPPSV